MDNNLRKELLAQGIDVDAGIKAHMGNEAMFLRILKIVIMDEKFDELFALVDLSDVKQIFEVSHSLKGTVGNVGLREIDTLVTEVCETTRHGGTEEVQDDILRIKSRREKILHVIV